MNSNFGTKLNSLEKKHNKSEWKLNPPQFFEKVHYKNVPQNPWKYYQSDNIQFNNSFGKIKKSEQNFLLQQNKYEKQTEYFKR